MKLIKLDAINSTNDFLKSLSKEPTIENYTVVTAQSQTKGRGQMGAVWNTETGKNLIMSLYVSDLELETNEIFLLNIAVSLAVFEVLEVLNIPKISVKWPNDIMSGSKKIGGILIENSLQNQKLSSTVIGLGLNVNQLNFENLPKASSLQLITGRFFEIEHLVSKIVKKIKSNFNLIANDTETLRSKYQNNLFKLKMPTVFEFPNGQKLMGKIIGVDSIGKLVVELENEEKSTFDIKEISMCY